MNDMCLYRGPAALDAHVSTRRWAHRERRRCRVRRPYSRADHAVLSARSHPYAQPDRRLLGDQPLRVKLRTWSQRGILLCVLLLVLLSALAMVSKVGWLQHALWPTSPHLTSPHLTLWASSCLACLPASQAPRSIALPPPLSSKARLCLPGPALSSCTHMGEESTTKSQAATRTLPAWHARPKQRRLRPRVRVHGAAWPPRGRGVRLPGRLHTPPSRAFPRLAGVGVVLLLLFLGVWAFMVRRAVRDLRQLPYSRYRCAVRGGGGSASMGAASCCRRRCQHLVAVQVGFPEPCLKSPKEPCTRPAPTAAAEMSASFWGHSSS